MPFRYWCQKIIADPTDQLCLHAKPGNMVLWRLAKTLPTQVTQPDRRLMPFKWHSIKSHLLCDFYAYFKLEKVVSTEQGNIQHILLLYLLWMNWCAISQQTCLVLVQCSLDVRDSDLSWSPILVPLFRRFVTAYASWFRPLQCHCADHAQLSQAGIKYDRNAFVLYGIRLAFQRLIYFVLPKSVLLL